MKKYIIYIILTCLVLNGEAKKPIEKQKNKPLNEKIKLKPASWFSDIVESIASLWQPVWGEFKIDGQFPLAGRHGLEKGVRGMFYKPNNNLTILQLNK
jgi:hypothetical protein